MKLYFGKNWLITIFISINLFLLLFTEVDATLSKSKKKKVKAQVRPPGVAYQNKKYPTKCHVCRLMVEEMEKSLRGEDDNKDMTEEEIKEKKRKERRKSKAERQRLRSLPMMAAIEDVCNNLLMYVPQSQKDRFRYVKQKTLQDVKSLIASQEFDDEESKRVSEEYDGYKHPETNRLMDMCDEIINKRENDLLKWNEQEEKSEDLTTFLCHDRVFSKEDDISCLDEKSVQGELWNTAFDAVFEKNPELKHQEF